MEQELNWKTLSQFVQINSPWLTLIGEKIQDDQDKVLDYWRVEKADSVVIITLQKDNFILPIPTYRPGISQSTLDFPGGRVPEGKTPREVAPDIISRELGINQAAIQSLTPLNEKGWAINSSFSNQKLYGFVAEIFTEIPLDPKKLGKTYPKNSGGISQLLEDLTCLQCRALLLEYLNIQSNLPTLPLSKRLS